jgi:ABC-type polysaccharide/polyol phosphate transport system ATPase subunit
MKCSAKRGLCLEVKNVGKTYLKNTNNRNNHKIKSLLRILFGIESDKTSNRQIFHALKNISINLKIGESLGILGLNGSGKSTLMQIIAGTLKPSSGQVFVRGKVAALLELGSGFSPDFTGKENVIINGKILGLTESQIRTKLESIQNFAEIGDFFNQPVRTYSSGMRVRLAFAVLVQVNPDILIIDEALAVGDARFKLKCFAFLQEFKSKGGTLILVSHDLNTIARLCSSSVLLDQGELLIQGKPVEVANEYSKILNTSERSLPNDKNNDSHESNQIHEIKTSKEFTYGGKKARISDIKLLNFQCDEVQVLESGEEFTVSFRVIARDKICSPVYGLTIKDAQGQKVYGQNTHFGKIKTKNLNDGDVNLVSFKQFCNLGRGTYFISLGMTRFEGENLEVIHRRYDVLEVKVINSDGSFGIANCYSKVAVKDISVIS